MNVEIAERLAARRKLAGLSQEALAEKLGVSRQAVSKWERSESSPDTDNLIALAKLYGVSLDELLYVDESIEDDVAFEAADRAEARVGPGGIHVDDGKDHVHVSWAEGVHVVDRNGEEVHVGWDGVRVNTTDPEAAEHIFARDNPFGNPFDPTTRRRAKKWLKFPFWALVIVAYLIIGMLSGVWGPTLFLLFLIPAYYLVAAAVVSHRVAPMLSGLYPIGAVAWFFWMGFMEGQWHPSWVIFLTIPLVEVIIVQLSKWWNARKGDNGRNAA